MKTKINNIIWKGKPSQIIYLHIHFFNLLLMFLIIYFADEITNYLTFIKPSYLLILVFFLFLRSVYLMVKIYFTRYTLYDHEIKYTRGIFSLKHDVTELYRIKDYSINEPFFLRIFSLSNIKMESSDRYFPTIKLKAVPKGFWLKDEIRFRVERDRRNKGVREID